MKLCIDCMRVNPDEQEKCLECGGDNFDNIRMTPFWNDVITYEEENHGEVDS